MRDVQRFGNWAAYFRTQNVLENPAKPYEIPFPLKIQIEIANEGISYVWIDGVGRRSFHKRNRQGSLLRLALCKHCRRLIGSWLRLCFSIWSNVAGPQWRCQRRILKSGHRIVASGGRSLDLSSFTQNPVLATKPVLVLLVAGCAALYKAPCFAALHFTTLAWWFRTWRRL